VARLAQREPRGLALAITALTAAVFAPSLSGEFLNYDDDLYVSANPALARGFDAESLRFAFTSFYGANWFPLTWLSWLADLSLFGLDARALHATNVLLHASASGLLYLALRRLIGSAWPSAFAALLFALHPTRVEAVAWIAARKDPLSAVFAAGALWVYAGMRSEGPRAPRLAAVAALYALGLLAKPTVLPLPALLLVLDYWPLGRLFRAGSAPDARRLDQAAPRRCVVEKLPLFALGIAHAGIVLAAQSAAGTVASVAQLGLGARAANALAQLPAYLGSLIWPIALAVPYPHAESAVPVTQVLFGALMLAGGSAFSVATARTHPHRLAAWLWFLCLLAPTCGIVQVGSQARADRYLYLALLLPGLALALDARALAQRWRLGPRALAALAVASCAALGARTQAQIRVWHDSETLFRHTLAVTGPNSVAHAHLGRALEAQGRRAEAVAEYRRALALSPNLAEVANALAWLLATAPEPALRLPREARELAEHAVALTQRRDPSALDALAAALAANGRFDEALTAASEAAARARERGRAEQARSIEARAEHFARGTPIHSTEPR
jgi:tetratricopeptide (TPR) repeat protein